VALHEHGRAVELPLDVQLAVYRVVQEALTNALRHAPGSPVEVSLRWEPGRLVVDVVNDLPPRRTTPAALRRGSGHGLLGMQERVSLLGARSTSARPGPAGGWPPAAAACRPCAGGRPAAPAEHGGRRQHRPGGQRLMPLRILLADDQAVIRLGFRMILDDDPGMQVVGEASDGRHAVHLARTLRPDVVLMDVRMPELDGIAATRLLAGPDVGDPVPVLVITTFDLDEYVFGALVAGARGFLLKDVSPAALLDAVRAVARGDAVVAPRATALLVGAYVSATPDASASDRLAALTDRERAVLVALARGLSNAEIADEMHLSEATVKSHVSRVLAKLDLRSRVQAVIAAYQSGLVPVHPDRPQRPGA
jgi:DNA-binding NarL/FixJ family response regulator